MSIFEKKFNRLRKKIAIALILLFFGLTLTEISGTDSFFIDKAVADGIKFQSGKWIPSLTIMANEIKPNKEDEWYRESPCVKISSDIDDATIYYSFAADNATYRKLTEDVCIYPPEGENKFLAYAVNNENKKWISKVISQDFKVGYEVKFGDVVINEIMWMGTKENSDDEWIELRNMTNHDINLSNWSIMYGGAGKKGHIEIPHGYKIKAKGYFLIMAEKRTDTAINLRTNLDKDGIYANVSEMSLKNDGELLILVNKNKKAVDKVWRDEKWPDGEQGDSSYMSMERNSEPGDGTLASSWHTCADKKYSTKDYWNKEGFNFGTPGEKNSAKDENNSFDYPDFGENVMREIIKDDLLPTNIKDENLQSENLPVVSLDTPASADPTTQGGIDLEIEEASSTETDTEPALKEKE